MWNHTKHIQQNLLAEFSKDGTEFLKPVDCYT